MNMAEGPRPVRICRPAFQDFQCILPRYYSRSELVRQMLKLKWWSSGSSEIYDLIWEPIEGTELCQLLVDSGNNMLEPIRVVFFEHSSEQHEDAIWILGGIRGSEHFDEIRKNIFVARSVIVQQRAE